MWRNVIRVSLSEKSGNYQRLHPCKRAPVSLYLPLQRFKSSFNPVKIPSLVAPPVRSSFQCFPVPSPLFLLLISSKRPFISLTSDFGVQTQGIGAMEGTALDISPDANVVHLMHGLPSFSIISGARTMETVQ